MHGKTIIERALELAREGKCRTTDDFHRALSREGYQQVSAHLSGPSLRAQLKAAIPKN